MLNHGKTLERPRDLVSQIYETLVEGMAAGHPGPGDYIVIEHIARQLGVSPTPVREALAQLVYEGLVRKEANGRLRVVPLTRDYVIDTYLVRGALEGLAAELIARVASAEDLAILQQALRSIEASIATNDYDSYRSAADLLHDTVANGARNPILSSKIASIYLHTGYMRGFWKHHFSRDAPAIYEEHQAIVEAIVRRDPAAARERMEAHIRRAGERLVDSLSTMPNDRGDVSTK